MTTRMQARRWHRVHARLRNILDWDRNTPFPNENFLVITCRDKAPIIIDKGHVIHSLQVMVIFLNDI
jgi:hypothetical protein